MTDSRRKGTKAEREFELILQAAGLQVERNLGGRRQVSGDIAVHDPPLAIEVRRRERILIEKWSKDHEESTPTSHIPIIGYRTNGEPWRVSCTLEDFLHLIGRDGFR